MHYLDARFVTAAKLQLNCRTTGLHYHSNSQVDYDTRHEHQKYDFPHIQFCVEVAMRQNDLRRFYLREQPVGTWVDQIPPWTTLATCKGTCKVDVDPCTTGLRDPPWGNDAESDRDHGQPSSLTCTF
eukprot:8388856-Pyramimonas_sp.AAC.1